MSIRVAIMGLGEMGQAIASAVLTLPEMEVVGVGDLDTSRVGRGLSSILSDGDSDVVVTNDTATLLGDLGEGGVLLHATGSRLEDVAGGIEAALQAGVNVVSLCEELACPWVRHPRIADRLDRVARQRGVTVLGTGVNPGFVFDRLVATCGQMVGRIERIEGLRIIDASRRRESLIKRLGIGMTPNQFEDGVEAGRVGHVGLMESVALAAMGTGHSVDEVSEDVSPLVATEEVRGLDGPVAAGRVRGARRVARAIESGREIARLEMVAGLEEANPRDEIRLIGDPGMTVLIPEGVHGDHAAAWAIVHAAQVVGSGAEAGLITILDLPAGR